MKVKYTDEERTEQIKQLRELLNKSGRVVYGIIKGVSRSGMSRDIDFYCFTCEDGKIVKNWLSHRIAGLLNYPFNDKKECIKVNGCGMDMIFSVVYNLGSVLYPNGDGETITGRNGDKEPETDGGYLLKHDYL